MKIALVTGHTPNYASMADITVPGKEYYAKKHGYSIFVQSDNFIAWPNRLIGFEKCFYIHDLMIKHPDIEWFWWTGSDCLITNYTTKLESFIDPEVHFIVTKDDHGIGADVFFIRNTPEGREYIQHLTDPAAPAETEQGWMWADEFNPKWRDITKYLPQYTMNSYILKWYPNKPNRDLFGQRQDWQQGDFVLQAISGYNPSFTGQDNYNWKCHQLSSHLAEHPPVE